MNMLTKNGNTWELNLGVPSMEKLMRRMFDLAGLDASLDFRTSRMEVEVRDADVTVKLPAPGCTPENFDIEVVNDFVTVRVKRECECADSPENEKHYIIRERSFDEFEESVKLPVEVRGHEATAKYTDGVLTLTIPREDAKKNTKSVIKVR